MADAIDPVINQINETQIRLSHIVKSMRATNKDTLHDLFTQRGLVFQIAQREKIAISQDELQKGIDQWRYKNRLESVEDTENWLSQRNISFADMAREIEYQILHERLKAQITAEDIQAHFASQKLASERREICWILVNELDIAEEIAMQTKDGRRDFHTLARQYSLDERTRPVSGYIGRQSRRDLPNDVAPLLFAAEVGEVIGPIKVETGYALYYIQQHCPAVLDEATEARCVRELYQLRLRREAKRNHISYPFLDSICMENSLTKEDVISSSEKC
ncbi:MAG: peptidylprolyl isomerase [Candidatus Latescibacteria bacterium]|nr:peptidylprolyl isomerase [Candidatus Latescibacterota bacterium]